MAYIPRQDTLGMTYDKFKVKYEVLLSIVRYELDIIEKFLENTQALRGWNTFFNPSITISEVNNKNMGHIYLGKFRIPVALSKKRGPNNQPIPHLITFVVCKYQDYPGDEFKEDREREAFRIAMEKLMFHYPERFEDNPVVPDFDFKRTIEEVRAFQSKWGFLD